MLHQTWQNLFTCFSWFIEHDNIFVIGDVAEKPPTCGEKIPGDEFHAISYWFGDLAEKRPREILKEASPWQLPTQTKGYLSVYQGWSTHVWAFPRKYFHMSHDTWIYILGNGLTSRMQLKPMWKCTLGTKINDCHKCNFGICSHVSGRKKKVIFNQCVWVCVQSDPNCALQNFHVLFNMNTNRKIYPDVFECDVLVSIREKKRLSLTMLDKINYFVDEISKKKGTIHLYWYSLK